MGDARGMPDEVIIASAIRGMYTTQSSNGAAKKARTLHSVSFRHRQSPMALKEASRRNIEEKYPNA